MKEFQIINPHIEGDFDPTISAKTIDEAGGKAWKKISKLIVNNVPRFAFSIKNMKQETLYHFKVEETISGGKVKLVIEKMDLKLTKTQKKSLIQKGGKNKYNKKLNEKDDDDDDDDDDSDKLFEKIRYQKYLHQSVPISYFWYNPVIYKFNSLFIPTFLAPLSPYVEIEMSSAFFG